MQRWGVSLCIMFVASFESMIDFNLEFVYKKLKNNTRLTLIDNPWQHRSVFSSFTQECLSGRPVTSGCRTL